jgi:outer membrane protein assembly factor BamB
MRLRRRGLVLLLSAVFIPILVIFAAPSGLAGEWAHWRGPHGNGVADESGLVSSWSTSGENLLWKADFTGRSTPVVFDGRVCAIGRAGTDATKHEVVTCWDAFSGKPVWEQRINVYHTAVPFTRAGWANIEGDPDTGYLYVHGVGGIFECLDRKGKVVWSRSLTEEFGRISGYGGRTHSPILDEDRVVLSFSNSGWGDQGAPRHRIFAFDKRTGDLVWVSTPGVKPETITTQATPAIAEIGGQRLLIAPNGDGWIYAVKARTGEKVWGFHFSKAGLNTSVVTEGNKVYATNGEENLDEATRGRVVAIDGSGTGDITKSGEIWRYDEVEVGFSTPTLQSGVLYVVDDSGNLLALDAATGKARWHLNLGTVGKGSPVWADGKIYAPEVNGRFHIIRPGAESAEVLHTEEIKMPGGRYAEIYASPAVAYGRVYVMTEAGLFCLGGKDAPRSAPQRPQTPATEVKAEGAPAAVRVVPADMDLIPGEARPVRAMLLDAHGAVLGPATGEWSLSPGLQVTAAMAKGIVAGSPPAIQAGIATLKASGLSAPVRVRVFPALPWTFDFESLEATKPPLGWVGGAARFQGVDKDGRKVLVKPFMDQGIERSSVFFGHSRMADYTIQGDLMGSTKGRKRPDMGLINTGYTLDLMGNHQRLQLRDWVEPRMEKTIEFPWQPDTWYTMKLLVEVKLDKAIIQGKVWPAGSAEPADWTITAEDTMPIRQGSPGLYGYSAADVFYDNIKVMVNPQ